MDDVDQNNREPAAIEDAPAHLKIETPPKPKSKSKKYGRTRMGRRDGDPYQCMRVTTALLDLVWWLALRDHAVKLAAKVDNDYQAEAAANG